MLRLAAWLSISVDATMLQHFERLFLKAMKVKLIANILDDQLRKPVEAVETSLPRFRTAPATEELQVEVQAIAQRVIGMGVAIIRPN